MTVHVGNMDDPPELPGCAHFTEHMLFLGTEKYPEEGEYKRYLLEHGGAGNASTGLEHTKYHFRVQSAYLEGALDRFAQFFISPTFTSSATEREISAVESEYAKNLQLDGRQKFQLMRNSSDPAHPYNRFGSGNRATLAEAPAALGLNARERMMQWYSEKYRTDLMTLCVYGDATIAELEAMVSSMFSAVPQGAGDQAGAGEPTPPPTPTAPPLLGHTPSVLAEHGLPFKLAQCGTVATINPVKQLRSVHLTWHLPHRAPGDTQRPYRLLSHLLGHEGEGSILMALKSRNWATGLSASTVSTSFQSNCSITVVLTPQGEREWSAVIRLIYAYIAMLRQRIEEGDIPQHVWGDMALRSNTQFAFKTPGNAQDTARAISLNLQYFAPAFAEYAPYAIADELPLDALKAGVRCLTPQNALIVRVGQQWAAECTQTERWFGARYNVEKVTEEHMQLWGALPKAGATPHEAEDLVWQLHDGLPGLQFPALQANGMDLGDGRTSPAQFWVWPCDPSWASDVIGEMKLPAKNSFMADKFDLSFPASVAKPSKSTATEAAYTRSGLTAEQCTEALQVSPLVWPTQHHPYPMTTALVAHVALPRSGLSVRVWSRPDGPWRLPKALVNVVFQLPESRGVTSATQQVLGMLYTNIVDDLLSHATYDAELAGANYAISRGTSSFVLQVMGYSQRLHKLAETVLSCMVPAHDGEWSVSEDVFRRQGELLARRLASKAQAQPRVHAAQHTASTFLPDHRQPSELLEALSACTSDMLSSEVRRLWHGESGGSDGVPLVHVATAGNIAPADASAFALAALRPFDEACAAEVYAQEPQPDAQACTTSYQTRAVQLPPGVYRHTAPHPNPADTNSAVTFTFQLGAAGDDEVCVLASVVAALMRQRCFDTLRTKEQLGYIVSSGCTVDGGVRCLRLIVQSATASTAFVEWRMHSFLLQFRAELVEMLNGPQPKLSSITAVLRDEWLSPPKTWSAWASSALRPITQGTFDFTQALRLARLSYAVTPEAVLAFYDASCLPGAPDDGWQPLNLTPPAQPEEGAEGGGWPPSSAWPRGPWTAPGAGGDEAPFAFWCGGGVIRALKWGWGGWMRCRLCDAHSCIKW